MATIADSSRANLMSANSFSERSRASSGFSVASIDLALMAVMGDYQIKSSDQELPELPRVSLADILADPEKYREARQPVFDYHRCARWPAARRRVPLRQAIFPRLEVQTVPVSEHRLSRMIGEVTSIARQASTQY